MGDLNTVAFESQIFIFSAHKPPFLGEGRTGKEKGRGNQKGKESCVLWHKTEMKNFSESLVWLSSRFSPLPMLSVTKK